MFVIENVCYSDHFSRNRQGSRQFIWGSKPRTLHVILSVNSHMVRAYKA